MITAIVDTGGTGAVTVTNDEYFTSLNGFTYYPNLNIALCPPTANTVLNCNLIGGGYQWQLNTGSGYVNLSNNIYYFGTNYGDLQITNAPSSWYGYQYRCIVNGSGYSRRFTLVFRNTWTGSADNTWENTANWSCGKVPDANTDVIINSGNVLISSNVTIRTLTVNVPGTVTVGTGHTLTITH